MLKIIYDKNYSVKLMLNIIHRKFPPIISVLIIQFMKIISELSTVIYPLISIYL